jgi:hypothetical protein
MRPTLRFVPWLVLAAALLVLPFPARAGERPPNGLGSPNWSDNPNLDREIFGGDSGSPWPVAIRDLRRDAPGNQTASCPAPLPAALPVVALVPGAPPTLLWLPVPAPPAAAPVR